jgi:hypothetical protein
MLIQEPFPSNNAAIGTSLADRTPVAVMVGL